MFTKEVLDLSYFPTILLFTTIFRIAMNVSSTRLILTTGTAGNVVKTFGQFVGGGDLIVGAIIFIILILIQFLVKVHYLRNAEKLLYDNRSKLRLLASLCHQNTGGQRDQQRRDLAYQSVTDGQYAVIVQRRTDIHTAAQHSHGDTAYQVDHREQQTRNRYCSWVWACCL